MTAWYSPLLDDLGRGAPLHLHPVSGGCIADARRAEFTDGSQVFVKSLRDDTRMFTCEAAGLQALEAADAIRVPEVLAFSEQALVLEWIETGQRGADFFESFGRQFAALHRCTGTVSGFDHDNFIGSTPQLNSPLVTSSAGEDWPDFWMDRRLRYQARLAEQNGHGSELLRLLNGVEPTLRALMAEAIEPPAILHGDLWGGNYLVDEYGAPCLIDPAAYFGHREADLAMTHLFGGFAPAFYSSYNEAFPLAPGHEERRPIYLLYHVLNHLNLFGFSYYAQALSLLRPYSAR